MYQFLYLFGPGALTWLVKNAGRQEEGKEQNGSRFQSVLEILVYALVNAAAMVLLLKPGGRVQLAVLANGMLDLQYGGTALVVSVVFAVFLGILIRTLDTRDAWFPKKKDNRSSVRISYQTLKAVSVLYIYLNVVVFLAGWLRPVLAVPGIFLFGCIFYRNYVKKTSGAEGYIRIEKKILVYAFAGITAWCIASGLGGFCMQAGDWHKHNAILHDLSERQWPVRYEQTEGGSTLLSYYILFYLFPALAGKLGGFRLAEFILLVQGIVGIGLVYLHICRFLKLEDGCRQLLALVLLAAFGGLLLPGEKIYGLIRPEDVGFSYHWFSSSVQIQYSTNMILLRWVFPQCIVPWIATLLMLEDTDGIGDFAWIGVPVFLYSCFAFAGLLPFYLGLGVLSLWKGRDAAGWLKKMCSVQNLYAAGFLFPVFLAYIAGNVFQDKPSDTLELIDYTGNWSLYILFTLSNFLIWSALLWKKERKNLMFLIANTVLLILPFFRYGSGNDLCMRASIPALFVIAVLFAGMLLGLPRRGRKERQKIRACTAGVCAAAWPSAEELFENAVHISWDGSSRADDWGTLAGQLVRDGTNNAVAYNYAAYDCEDSFFIRYMAKGAGKQ